MSIKEQNKTNCELSNHKYILIILVAIICILLTTTIYFVNKSYNREKVISDQLEYVHKLGSDTRRQLAYYDDMEHRMQKLFDSMESWSKDLTIDLWGQDIADSPMRLKTLLNNSETMVRSSITALDKEYLIRLEVPGFTKEQIKIDLVGDSLVIQSSTKEQDDINADKENPTGSHYVSRTFKQVIRLSYDIDHEAIKSSLKDGILTISIPRVHKQLESRPIVIE
ncbi:MAG: hypothetical protein Tsb006_5360 [Rickettsiaceae bacterium]